MLYAAVESFEAYRKNYNSLSDDVDSAYALLLQKEGYADVINTALEIIRKYGAAAYCGISLLHRHFSAPAKTLFVERQHTPRAKDHQTVLVTSPTSGKNLPKNMAPHRFRINRAGDLQALEFTTDPIARKAWAKLSENGDLLRALGKTLAGNRFSKHLGVGVFARQADIGSATRVFIEETDFEKKQSVVHVLPTLPRVAGRLVPTMWTFQDAGNGCCSQACVAYCSHPTSGLTFGYCGHRKGGHIGCA